VELFVVLLGALVLAVVASWPLAPLAWSLYPSDPTMPDLNIGFWLPGHLAWAIAEGTHPLQAAELHWPFGQDNRNLLWNVGIQALQLPFFLLTEAVPAYNLSIIGLAALNGLGGWVLGRVMGGDRASATLGAVVLVCSPYAWSELVQGRGEQGLLCFVALTVAGLVQLQRRPGARLAVAVGLAWALAGLCYWFYAYFLALLVAVLALALAARRRWTPLAMLCLSGLTAALVVAPIAGPLLLSASQDGSSYLRSAQSTALQVTGVSPWTSLKLTSMAWPWWTPARLRDAFPFTASGALILGAVLARKRTSWVPALGLAGLVFALGPQLYWTDDHWVGAPTLKVTMPFAALKAWLPGFWRLVWPYRLVALTVVAAAGCAGALVSVTGRWRWYVTVVLSLACWGELVVAQRVNGMRSVWTLQDPLVVPDLFRELAQEPGEHPILVLPFRGPVSSLRWVPYHRQAVTEGNGDMEDFGQSTARLAWIAESRALRALQEVGRGPTPPAGSSDPAALSELGALGLHWAVLFTGGNEVELARYRSWFARSPDLEDGVIAAWRLESRGR